MPELLHCLRCCPSAQNVICSVKSTSLALVRMPTAQRRAATPWTISRTIVAVAVRASIHQLRSLCSSLVVYPTVMDAPGSPQMACAVLRLRSATTTTPRPPGPRVGHCPTARPEVEHVGCSMPGSPEIRHVMLFRGVTIVMPF